MIELTDGITIVIREPHKVQRGYDIWRVDVSFYTSKPNAAKIKNDYEIWATIEFIEDFLQIPKSPSTKQVKKFAREFIKKRFIESSKNIPEEYGAFCSNTTGIKLVDHGGTLLSYFEDLKSIEK
jgi:hypothetical protein